ncbi:MAG: M48 family metalloprotease [Acidimicrobiia bacterium]
MIKGINDQISANRRRFLVGIAAFVAFVALVGAVAGGAAGLVAGAVVGVAVAGAAYLFSDRIALSAAKARPAHPVEQARLHNIVEGLCVAAGLPKPALFVVSDRVPNAFSAGRNPDHASLVVTTGLLEGMTRVELEGVVAHELAHIRNRDTLLTSTAVGLMFFRGFLPPRRETLADVTGVRITRYPPGLIAALEKLRRTGTNGRSGTWVTAHLWINGPNPPLDQRLTELRDL